MAGRPKLVLPSIIGHSQILAAQKGKITDLLGLIRDVILQCNISRIKTGVLVNLDFTGAFDLVSHKYLFSTMTAFGITGKFLSCLENTYRSAQSRISINGFCSEAVDIQRRMSSLSIVHVAIYHSSRTVSDQTKK